ATSISSVSAEGPYRWSRSDEKADPVHGPIPAVQSRLLNRRLVDRRTFIETAGAGALGVARAAGADAPRQVVVLMTDTTRWDMLNCYRKTGLKTPNLDRLAAQGVRFE